MDFRIQKKNYHDKSQLEYNMSVDTIPNLLVYPAVLLKFVVCNCSGNISQRYAAVDKLERCSLQ